MFNAMGHSRSNSKQADVSGGSATQVLHAAIRDGKSRQHGKERVKAGEGEAQVSRSATARDTTQHSDISELAQPQHWLSQSLSPSGNLEVQTPKAPWSLLRLTCSLILTRVAGKT